MKAIFPFVSVAEQLSATHGAVKMLHTRVRLIVDYLNAVKTGVFLRQSHLVISGRLCLSCVVILR